MRLIKELSEILLSANIVIYILSVLSACFRVYKNGSEFQLFDVMTAYGVKDYLHVIGIASYYYFISFGLWLLLAAAVLRLIYFIVNKKAEKSDADK